MILIYVRATEDWENYSIEKLLNKKTLGSGFVIDEKLLKKIKLAIDKWDNFFNINYFSYRQILKKISLSTFEKYKVYYNFDKLKKEIKDEDFVCATDDDDWFRDDLIYSIPKHMQNNDCIYWNHIVYCTHELGSHLWYDYHNNMGSNNYAISGKKFKSLPENIQFSLLDNENSVLDVCENYNLKNKFVNDLMSCYIWHIGSMSLLVGNTKLNIIDKKIKKIYKKAKLNFNINKNQEWTKKHLKELCLLHNSLKEIKCL